jgi:hypothetical protein
MLSLILGFITGLAGPISLVVNKITDLKMARVTAQSDKERAEIDQQIEAVHDRKAVLIAEAGNRIAGVLNAGTRMALAMPVIVVLWKLLVWDKTVGPFYGCAGSAGQITPGCEVFRTDILDPNLWYVVMIVSCFYFLATWKRK